MPFTWSNPSTGGLLNDTFYWTTGAGCSGTLTAVNLGSAATSYTLSGLTAADAIHVTVTTWNATGQSGQSSCVATASLPDGPTGVSVTSSTATGITWGWTNPTGTLTDDYLYWEAGTSCSAPTEVNIGSVVTSDTVNSLSGATEYCAYVVAASAGGTGNDSSTATGWTYPAAPTGPSASAASLTSATVSWTNPSGTLTNDYVYYEQGGSCSSATLDNVGSVVTSAMVTGLATNKEYCFYVEAVGDAGASAASSDVYATTESVPAAPTALTVGALTTTTIPLTWSNPSTGGLLNSTVYWYSGGSCSGTATVHSAGSAVTSYTITGLTTNVRYAADVTVWNATGQSSDSACVTAVTASVPAAPTSLSVGTVTATTIPLTWSNPSTGGLVNSTVYWYSGGSCTGSPTVHSAGSAVTSYTITGLTTNDRYAAQVTAWNATGQSLDSNCVTAITASVPAAPTSVTVGSVTTTSIPLTWSNPSTGGLVNDTVYYRASSTCGGTMTGKSTSGSATSYTITSLSGATEYAVEVTAWNATGQSVDSSCTTGTTLPAAPTSLALSSSTVTTIVWTWSNPGGTLTDIDFYWEAGTSCSSPTLIDLGSVVTTKTLTGLSGATEYCSYVKAVSAGGAGAASSTATGWTLPGSRPDSPWSA